MSARLQWAIKGFGGELTLKNSGSKENSRVGEGSLNVRAGDEDVGLTLGDRWNDSSDVNAVGVDGSGNGNNAEARHEGDEAAGWDLAGGGEFDWGASLGWRAVARVATAIAWLAGGA